MSLTGTRKKTMSFESHRKVSMKVKTPRNSPEKTGKWVSDKAETWAESTVGMGPCFTTSVNVCRRCLEKLALSNVLIESEERLF